MELEAAGPIMPAEETNPGQPYRRLKAAIFRDLAASDLAEPARQAFLEIIAAHGVAFTDHIRQRNDWLIYLFFSNLVARLVADRRARLIDWGGQYGQVTQMLRALGFINTYNYLLHRPSFYELFEKRFDLPTIYGQEPNVLTLDTASVDGFISSGVLEHVTDDGLGREDLILREIHRVLKPEGLFFVWNLPAVLGSSDILAQAFGRWHHKRRYWRGEIVRALEKADFEIVHLDKHKLLPGTALGLFEGLVNPVTLLRIDDWLSRLFPLSLFARDFALVARKAGAPKPAEGTRA